MKKKKKKKKKKKTKMPFIALHNQCGLYSMNERMKEVLEKGTFVIICYNIMYIHNQDDLD